MKRYKLTFHFRNGTCNVLELNTRGSINTNWNWKEILSLNVDDSCYMINLLDVTHCSVEVTRL